MALTGGVSNALCIVDLVERVARVSVETVGIVRGLQKLPFRGCFCRLSPPVRAILPGSGEDSELHNFRAGTGALP